MAKLQLILIAAPLVALLLMIGSAHATCTAINHSNAPMQIQLLPPNASVSAGVSTNVPAVVEVAAQATVDFALQTTTAAIRLVNQLTSNTSPTAYIFDGSIVRIEASATIPTRVDVFLDASVNGVSVNVAKLSVAL